MPHVPNDNRPNKKTFYHHLQAYRSQRDTERSRIMSILMDSIQTTSQIGHTGFIEFLEHRRELYSKLWDFLLYLLRLKSVRGSNFGKRTCFQYRGCL